MTVEREQRRALQAERDFVRTVVDTAPAFFCVLDVDGRIDRFDTALEAASKVPDDDDASGSAVLGGVPRPRRPRGRPAAIEERRSGELEHDWCGGRRVAWQVTLLPDGKLLVTGIDVTDRRRAERDAEWRANFLSAVGTRRRASSP